MADIPIKYGVEVKDANGNKFVFPVAYDGFNLSYNKVWSSDTGRNNNGKMIGTIVAIKRKIECKLTPMTLDKAKQLNDLVSDSTKPFVTVYFNEFGVQGKMTGYFGDVNFPYKGTNVGKDKSGLIVGATIDVIER